jgi:CheY-like chemotaxis protein
MTTPSMPATVLSQAASTEARQPSTGDAPSVARRVLIVDDNRDAAESLAMLVEVLGAEAHVCFDGASALAAFDDHAPNLVLLDLTMPGMDGFEVVRRLRERGAHDRARLIALSGRAEDDFRRQSLEAGFDAHLVKPVDVATLQSTLAGGVPA